MARVCVVGSVNVDQFFTVAALPGPGETVLASAVRTEPGGKGGNQAVAAARAGAEVTFVGAVGTDPAGAQLRTHLSTNGVDLTGVEELSAPSGSAVILVGADGANLIVVAPGANGHLTLASAAARSAIAGCEVLLVQLEIPVATAVAAAREAHSVGATVIVNASPVSTDAAVADLAAVTDVVVVNETEEPHWDWPTPHRVVTRGARGASYSGPDGTLEVPAPEVEAIDTTGAGDVFAGVLAADWLTGTQRALRRACAAGALATLVAGAGDCAPRAEAIDDALLNDLR
ncbi:PfkB family carbohydrate kinase [Mycobacterium sp. DL592]|uniref:PfkB family carbohydrate kinase n=1 Tax=Mycobacterium sp. DL592 TaxID=2675524 RepID=UPI0014237C32|nr:PfkB family carbohydrate kinase [Mycobacterium sp. DL592]